MTGYGVRLFALMAWGPLLLAFNSCSTRPYQEQQAKEERQLNLTELRFRFTLQADRRGDERILSAKRIYIFPYDEKLDLADPDFQKMAHLLYVALEDLGYARAERPQDADVGIVFQYIIAGPQEHQITYTIPLPSEKPYLENYQAQLLLNGLPIAEKPPSGWWNPHAYETITQINRDYDRRIYIWAYDLEKWRRFNGLDKDDYLWRAKIRSIGESDKREEVLLHLLAASKRYFGHQLEAPLKLQIKAQHPAVKALEETAILSWNLWRAKPLYETFVMPRSYPLRLRLYRYPAPRFELF